MGNYLIDVNNNPNNLNGWGGIGRITLEMSTEIPHWDLLAII